MALNASLSSENASNPTRVRQLVSDETERLVFIILSCGVAPTIGAIGISLNALTIRVLFRHGLHKCSNILLISLAFTDLCYLIGYNNIPNILYTKDGGKFLYSYSTSYFLFILYIIQLLMDYALAFAALTIPMLITLERLIAVFLPLKASLIVTPFRTWLLVISVIVFSLCSMGYTCFWYKFEYIFDQNLNRSVGILTKSDLFYRDVPKMHIFEEFFFSIKVPPLFTLLGCVAIVVKVKMASKARAKMTNKTRPTSKTTQTLLAVCFVYLCVCAIIAVPQYLPKEFSSYSLTEDNRTNVGKIMYQVLNISIELNSSWNFLVYIAFNKNFRDIFKEIMTKSCRKPSAVN